MEVANRYNGKRISADVACFDFEKNIWQMYHPLLKKNLTVIGRRKVFTYLINL